MRPDEPCGRPAPQTPRGEVHPEHDPSVFAEPWFQASGASAPVDRDAIRAELRADRGFEQAPRSLAETAEHSVWDEVTTSGELGAVPDADAVTWFRYYQQRAATTPVETSWIVTLATVIVAGPAAVLGTLWNTGMSVSAWVAIVVLGPALEEVMKVALPLWLVERRPWLIRSNIQLLLCALAGGLAFAVVENFLYLHVYVDDPSPALVRWRWTVCVALHTGCSAIASVGLMQIRRQMLKRQAPPQVGDAAGWLTAAFLAHAAYNAFALLINERFE
jgi:hypothetical protein